MFESVKDKTKKHVIRLVVRQYKVFEYITKQFLPFSINR